MPMSNDVLVTGAPGWLGNALVEALQAAGRRVRCLVHPSASLTDLPKDAEAVRGDVRDAAAIRRFVHEARDCTLFHIAGLIHPRLFTREFHDVNVRGSALLLEAAERAGLRRAVIMSSNSAVGVRRDGTVFDETSPCRPEGGYGRSKLALERLVAGVERRGTLQTVVIRAPWFYGTRQPARQSLFFRMIQKGSAPIIGDGRNLRSMAYIDNLCHGLMRAADVDAARGQTYWIADVRPYAWTEILDTVERLLETEFHLPVAHRRMRLPALAGPVATLADDALQALGLYVQKIHVLSEIDKTIACSVAKAQQEIGYAPTVELEEGMRRSIAWWRASEKGETRA